jgi:tRNA(Ile)-lysidine synthase
VVEFATEALRRGLVLRSRRAGDRIRIAPHGSKKVHDIMVEMRVPRRVRHSWPVLAVDDTVIWIPGLAVDADMQSASRTGGGRVRFAWRRTQV